MIAPLRDTPQKKIIEEVKKINKFIEHAPMRGITTLNDAYSVSAMLITQKLRKKKDEQNYPAWSVRMCKVENLQKNLSRLREVKQRDHDDRHQVQVEYGHNIKTKVSTELKKKRNRNLNQ